MSATETGEVTEEEVAKTIAEYERIAIATGARVQFDAPEFSADGVTWSQVWLPETEPPVAARARVHRDGAPSTVVALWRDALPTEESWKALWTARPMPLFGAFVRRDAIRHAFRDVIGDRREPGDHAPAAEPWEPARDWAGEIESAPTSEDLTTVWAAARHARARTAPLEVLYKTRMEALTNAEPAEPTAPARPAPRDYLPGNRADRRAAARKKGRRK